ncbi:DUF669 domain-containing protein [Salicibibacter kimchii]|uniref:DUF669 domain-containing protein n=1 Tax=Salicibibacter kimchii TaxID=2099786 RepID=A0A345BUG5_9BACI|nr:DUF669 domain-containing protein [Salicibibacter kimchii]AXF54596.1 DUF669 domain-containing protein [Salicibibacter kimchii]
MGEFNLDFNDVYEGKGQIKDGWYEVIVNRCNEDAAPNGAEYAEFDLIIRNDIDQSHQNQHIFEKNFKAKSTHKYNMKIFNTIGKACQLENGKTYNSFDDLLNDYVGKTALVYVKNETSEYNGKTYENLNVKMWNQSKFPDVQHVPKSGGEGSSPQPVDISDDDLPF